MRIGTIYCEMLDVGAPITDLFPPAELSSGGIVVNDRYLIQVSKYESKPIILSIIEEGEVRDAPSFDSINELIQFIMEN